MVDTGYGLRIRKAMSHKYLRSGGRTFSTGGWKSFGVRRGKEGSELKRQIISSCGKGIHQWYIVPMHLIELQISLIDL